VFGVNDPAPPLADGAMPFGRALVAQGLVDSDEVERTVELQSLLARRGVFLRLGELLVARGVLKGETVAEVLALQGTVILVCPQCLAQFNVIAYQREREYRCSRCDDPLRRPDQLEDVAVEDTLVHADWASVFELKEGHRFGDYEILGQISRGGMGIVYKARQRSLDRVVAMKVIAAAAEGAATDRASFQREARAVASLRHPNIVAIYEVDRIGEVDFYTMDYVEGVQLQRAVAADGLNEREVVELLIPICDAVDYAHSQGLLHRDLKPQNVLIDRRRRPILIDFGIAGSEHEVQGGNEIVGSPAYLAPEYISGAGPYDRRSEVYALGATLYTALAGRPPHAGVDTAHVLRKANVEPVVPLRSIRRSVDRDLARIVSTAMERSPQRRYATARDLRDDLRRWLTGEELAGATRGMGRTWQLRRGKVAAAVGIFLALVLPAWTGYLTLQLAAAQQALRGAQFDQRLAHDEHRASLAHARLENGRLLVRLREWAEAELTLTRALADDALGPVQRREGYALRAKAREALGDLTGADQDRQVAATLAGDAERRD